MPRVLIKVAASTKEAFFHPGTEYDLTEEQAAHLVGIDHAAYVVAPVSKPEVPFTEDADARQDPE